jgi:hypothetical protein
MSEELKVSRVAGEEDRSRALEVLREVYAAEKGWVQLPEQVFPAADLDSPALCWFLAEKNGRPVGVTRVLYELPRGLYQSYQLQLVDPRLDIEAFLSKNRLAEVGRFAVIPEERQNIRIAAILMRAATTETVERGFTHFITDVFEADPNSPYHFHKKVLGFEVVATHDHGELAVKSRRITMLLDLKAAFRRLSLRRSWIYRFITEGWNERLLQQLSA